MRAGVNAVPAVEQSGSSVDELLAEINAAELAAQQQQAKKVQATSVEDVLDELSQTSVPVSMLCLL